ncbi:hypothetical protein ACRRTK_003582 [Alexandromys fortis]
MVMGSHLLRATPVLHTASELQKPGLGLAGEVNGQGKNLEHVTGTTGVSAKAGVKGNRKCELNCQATGYRFYVRQAEKVIDGTPCDQNGTAICVSGQCKHLKHASLHFTLVRFGWCKESMVRRTKSLTISSNAITNACVWVPSRIYKQLINPRKQQCLGMLAAASTTFHKNICRWEEKDHFRFKLEREAMSSVKMIADWVSGTGQPSRLEIKEDLLFHTWVTQTVTQAIGTEVKLVSALVIALPVRKDNKAFLTEWWFGFSAPSQGSIHAERCVQIKSPQVAQFTKENIQAMCNKDPAGSQKRISNPWALQEAQKGSQHSTRALTARHRAVCIKVSHGQLLQTPAASSV